MSIPTQPAPRHRGQTRSRAPPVPPGPAGLWIAPAAWKTRTIRWRLTAPASRRVSHPALDGQNAVHTLHRRDRCTLRTRRHGLDLEHPLRNRRQETDRGTSLRSDERSRSPESVFTITGFGVQLHRNTQEAPGEHLRRHRARGGDAPKRNARPLAPGHVFRWRETSTAQALAASAVERLELPAGLVGQQAEPPGDDSTGGGVRGDYGFTRTPTPVLCIRRDAHHAGWSAGRRGERTPGAVHRLSVLGERGRTVVRSSSQTTFTATGEPHACAGTKRTSDASRDSAR